MTLPGISGRRLFEELRGIRPDIRIIVTTAYTKEMAVNAVGVQQTWEFIRKPYHIADLVSLLRRTDVSGRESARQVPHAGYRNLAAVGQFRRLSADFLRPE